VHNAVSPPAVIMPGGSITQTISYAALGLTDPPAAVGTAGQRAAPITPVMVATAIVNRIRTVRRGQIESWVTVSQGKLGSYAVMVELEARNTPSNLQVQTGTAGQSVDVLYKLEPTRLGTYFPFDRESTGRAFCYGMRIEQTPGASKWPYVQSVTSMGQPIDAIIEQTCLAGGAMFTRAVATKLDKLSQLDAVRAVLGDQFANIIVNSFSAKTFTVPDAMIIVSITKRGITVAPYHSAASASLVTFNSPSLLDQIWGAIVDVGKGFGEIVGSAVGAAIPSTARGFITSSIQSSPDPNFQLRGVSLYDKFAEPIPYHIPFKETTDQRLSRLAAATKKANRNSPYKDVDANVAAAMRMMTFRPQPQVRLITC